jgi:hypothetical protein
MKIKTDEPSRVIIEQAGKRPGQKEAAKFGELLQRTLERTRNQAQEGSGAGAASGLHNGQTPGMETAGSLGSIADIEALRSIGSIQAMDEQQGPILERVEQLLDTLEEYQRTLGSASSPTESLQPLIGRMEEHNKSLAAVLVTLPDGDNLKDILNRVLITSVVEVQKFNRGDYS